MSWWWPSMASKDGSLEGEHLELVQIFMFMCLLCFSWLLSPFSPLSSLSHLCSNIDGLNLGLFVFMLGQEGSKYLYLGNVEQIVIRNKFLQWVLAIGPMQIWRLSHMASPSSLCCLEANTLITLPKLTATYVIVCQKEVHTRMPQTPRNTKVLKNCFFVAEMSVESL